MSLSSSPSKLYVMLIIFIGLVGGYVFYSQFVLPAEAEVPPVVISNQDNLKAFQNLTMDFNLLTNTIAKGLIISGESPVNPGVTGTKKDLFAPIQ